MDYVNIKLNSNMVSQASKIWIAKTMLHELIHAEIIRLLVSEGDNNLNPNSTDFYSLSNILELKRILIIIIWQTIMHENEKHIKCVLHKRRDYSC